MFMYVKATILSGNCLAIASLRKRCITNSSLLLLINAWFAYRLIKVYLCWVSLSACAQSYYDLYSDDEVYRKTSDGILEVGRF